MLNKGQGQSGDCYSTRQRHAHGDRRGCRAYVAVCYAHGALSFEIAAHKVDNRLDTEGILTLEYRISAGGEADENKVIIKTEEI